MKLLVFHLGDDRYGLPLGRIERVLPLMTLKQLPGVPDYVAGLMNLHGAAIPVLDLSQLALGRPSLFCFDTRIVLIDYPLAQGPQRLLGLIAEQVSGTQSVADEGWTDSSVVRAQAPYIGQLLADENGLLQLLKPDQLLSPPVRERLFGHNDVVVP